MRLSPKSIFFGLVALGLPISVAIGWTLATPARRPASIGAPGGTGGLGAVGNGGVGAAPERAAARPATTVKFSPPPARSAATLPPATAPSAAPTATMVPPPTATAPSTLPSLVEPPVPTPTEITVTPSNSASAPPSDGPMEWPEDPAEVR